MTQEPRPQSPVPAQPGDEDIFDFAGIRQEAGFVLRAPLRHRRIALACLLGAGLAALASTQFVRDMYQVQAEILARRNPVMLTLSNPSLSRTADWDAPTSAARETVMRRDNLLALCRQTNMVDRFLKSRSPLGRLRARIQQAMTGHETTRDELTDSLVDTMEKRLQTWVTPEGVVTIKFEWPDPEIAYHVVEAAVQNFLETRHATEVAVLGETITLLEGSAAKLQRDLDKTMAEVERRERARPRPSQRRLPETPKPALAPVRKDTDLARLESTLNARKRALGDLEEFRHRRLADLQAQLQQKVAIFAERHPEVQLARQSIEALAQPSPQLNALRMEVRDLERELAQRGGPAAEQVAPTTAVLPADLFAPRYYPEEDSVRSEYDRAQLRFVADQYSSALLRISWARLELEATQAAFKYRYSVTSPPIFPQGPKRNYGLLRALGGVLGGLGLAFFATTVLDLRSGRILEERQIARHLGLPVLARLRS